MNQTLVTSAALNQTTQRQRSFVLFKNYMLCPGVFRRGLLLLLLLAGIGTTADAALRTWTGATNTNWATASNWSPAVVPVAGDSVVISVFPIPANMPVIFSGTTARAANVLVRFGRTLTIQSGAVLELDGNGFYGLGIGGTVTNSGTIRVKRASFHGIDMSGDLTNNGTIELGEITANPYSFQEEGIRMSDPASVINNAGATITILRPGNNGILLFTGNCEFTNHGTITVREAGLNPATAATADGIDVRTGTFTNETTGIILLSTVTACGLHCRSSGNATNKGQITIRNVGLTPENEFREGINLASPANSFTNTLSGRIRIDTVGNNGITNQGAFTNSGEISIRKTSNGFVNLGAFNNQAGAILKINNISNDGLVSGGFGGVAANFGTITMDTTAESGVVTLGFGGVDNRSILNIGNVGNIGEHGILNGASFINQASGTVTINRTADAGVKNAVSIGGIAPEFINAGQLTIGGAGNANSGIPGIENLNDARFKNLACGMLTTYQSLVSTDSFLNEAFVFIKSNVSSSISGTFINAGVIHDPNGSFNGQPLTNNDFIISAVSGECPIANALQKGAGANVTIAGTWYKDQALTMSAGTYNQAANTFTFINPTEGTQTLYFRATDNAFGCSTVVSIAVTYNDVTPPTITCPANTTVAANASCQGQVGSYAAVTLSDNCNLAPTVTQSPASSTTLTGHNAVQTVRLTANDGNGNTATCTLTVTLRDVAPPTIACPANTTVAANASCQGQVGSYAAATLSDNCNPASTVTQSPASSTTLTGHNATQTVTLTANDGNGNTASCTLTVTLKDVTPPAITCPANTTIAANADCQGQIGNYNAATLSDNCNPSPTVTQSPASSTILTGHNAVQTVTLTANDGNGNTATCSLTVTLKDVTPPAIGCPPPVTVSCAGQVPVVNLNAVSASDNCGTPTKSHVGDVISNQTCANRFTVTRTYRAIDGSNNSATCSQIITVLDNTAPVFSFVPANVTVQCNSIPSVGNVLASDGCEGDVTYQYLGETRTDGNCQDTYMLTRRWTATDVCGNVRTATQVITVRDTQAPVFTNVPANVTVQCNAVPVAAMPNAFDNCDASVTITYNGETRTNGSCLDSYTLIRRWTATDNCGNTRTASQRITVTDTQAPTFANVPANLTLQCSDPVPGVVNPTASDNCDNSVTIQYLGQTTVGASCANSYVLQRRWKATDNCGNFTITTQTITVQDTQAPVFTSVPANITIQCSTPLPFPGTATATDNCGGFVQVVFQGEVRTDGDCLYDYTITRTWRAIDQCGNSATATQVITVVDTQAPVFQNIPANISVSCAGIPDVPVVTAQDNCGPATVSYEGQSQSPGDCQSGYTITRTWTVTDLCSNISTYTQTITVQGQSLEEPGGEERSAEENGGDRPSSTVHRLPFAVWLAPNPAFDVVQVRYELEQSMEATILVSDLSGRVVHTRTYLADAGENVYGLELETLAGGVYLVQVRAGGQRAVEKLIVLEK